MIIGTGMIARAFSNYQDNGNIIIFASGVSNSQEKNAEVFQREKSLLLDNLKQFKDKKFIYFSTCSIEDPSMQESMYVIHKRAMEELIHETHSNYHTFRLPQVVGKTHSPTIIHYLYEKIITGDHFDLWYNSSRNLIDVDDIVKIADAIITQNLYQNEILNIASTQSMDVVQIVEIIETICQKKGNYTRVEKGIRYTIDISEIKPLLDDLHIRFDDEYIHKTISKYYHV